MPILSSGVQKRAVFKRFAQIYLPLLVVLSIALYVGVRFNEKLLVKHTSLQEASRIAVAKGRIVRELSTVDTDLRVIVNLPAFREYLESGDPVLRRRLENIFLDLARETRRYDQMRYIDASGQERIRVNYNNGKPIIVPSRRLQSKADRYYFKDTIKLGKGEIYASRLDLNVEKGQLEIPYKPTVRYGTPVFNSNGHVKGVIMLNYLGSELLHNFQNVMHDDANPYGGMLLSRDGYWMSGAFNSEDEWGFMLGRLDRSFAHDFPEAWQTISSSEQGTLVNEKGLFVYDTAYPLSGWQHQTWDMAKAREYHWKIVTFTPHAALSGAAIYNQPIGKVLIGVIYLLFAMASYFAARISIGRKLANEQIVKLNSELEQRVAERTAGEENLSVTLNSIGDAVMATDAEGRITRLNLVAEQLTGWQQSEAIGQPVEEVFRIVNQKTREPAPIPVAATLEQGVSQELERDTMLIARDGSECHIADSCAPIRDRVGKVIGTVLVFRDVTLAYAAQAALQDSAMRIQTILNTVADGIVTIDERGIVETINPAAEQLFGYKADEVIGQNVSMLMPEPHRSQHDSYLEHYRNTKQARVIGMGREVAGLRKNGSQFPMYLAISEMNLDGHYHFTGIVHDLTESKQTEQSLIAAKEQAEFANRAKDSFLATMSHEIRTPLTGMLGMLEVLSLTKLDEEQSETLMAAWNSGSSLLRIVSDILDWSKIEEGKLVLSPRATSISQLLQEVVNTYSRVASSKSLSLWHHVDPRLHTAHIVDPLRLSQVLNNFVSNAIKFTPHGEIELRAELLERQESGERIRFSVRDTGIGIPKDAQHQLFQRYKQQSADTARMYGGTGLGLAICRRLAEMLDGQVALESEPGMGATFSLTLTLPVSAAPEEIALNMQPYEVESRKVEPLADGNEDAPLVLAVDDHPVNRDLLARQIGLLGLRAEIASNGVEALEMWQKGNFALVITDCHMPEMDGYTLAREIRNIEVKEKMPHTPIIAWTANALAEREGHFGDTGMDDFLIKPATMAMLRNMLAKVLGIADAEDDRPPVSAAPELKEQQKVESPIDRAVLEMIVPDSAGHARVLGEFITHIREDHAKLNEALERMDAENADLIAHRMKGSSRMVGARELGSICASIEQASKEKDMVDAKEVSLRLPEAIENVERYLAELEESAK